MIRDFIVALDYEIDGMAPADVLDQIATEIAAHIPGVMCLEGQEEFAVLVNSLTVTAKRGPRKVKAAP